MQKDFDKWNTQKKRLHNSSRGPFVAEREIWWCSLGMNIGREQDGHGDDFERPIVIVKTLSPDTFIGLPLSTKKRLEKFQSLVTHGDIQGFALLDQIRVFDTKRLRRKIGMLSQDEFVVIKSKLTEIL